MKDYVAFLRGVNVGGRGVLKMERLRRAFADLGHQRVETFIQSGNVLFAAEATGGEAALAAEIQAGLAERLGMDLTVLLLTRREIERLVRRDPFGDEEAGLDVKKYVAFLARRPKAGFDLPIASAKDGLEVFSVEGREAFTLSRRVNGRYGFPNGLVEASLGVPATTRNWNTVLLIGGHHT
jgi:uncharacterized protein (DUF1697 family)